MIQTFYLQEFVRTLSETYYDTFEFFDDGHIEFEELFERFSRQLALKLACNSGNERCLTDTFNVNRRFVEDGHSIPKGLEPWILCSGFRGTGKQTQWAEFYRIMQTTTDSTLKTQMLDALGCTEDADSLASYLESTVADGNAYTQAERRTVLSGVLNSGSGLSAVLNFVTNFELDIIRLFGYASLEDILNVPARTIKTRSQETVFVNFLDSLGSLGGTNSSRITAIIDGNFEAQQRYSTSIDFIRQYLYQQTSTVDETEPTQPTLPATEPTQPTEPATTTTPSGAATIGIQFATLLASLLIVIAFKM